ncbi:MAG: hypothetical protein HYS81_02450 [Candidatus Aenigmatarchaeota archaeon]|nr:MAG: hypothetical protein HYS81_02450 [Candidatus Aenigmarchaeota archaeon]
MGSKAAVIERTNVLKDDYKTIANRGGIRIVLNYFGFPTVSREAESLGPTKLVAYPYVTLGGPLGISGESLAFWTNESNGEASLEAAMQSSIEQSAGLQSLRLRTPTSLSYHKNDWSSVQAPWMLHPFFEEEWVKNDGTTVEDVLVPFLAHRMNTKLDHDGKGPVTLYVLDPSWADVLEKMEAGLGSKMRYEKTVNLLHSPVTEEITLERFKQNLEAHRKGSR